MANRTLPRTFEQSEVGAKVVQEVPQMDNNVVRMAVAIRGGGCCIIVILSI